MAHPPDRTLVRTASLLVLGYALAITGFTLQGIAHEGEAEALLMALFVIPWLAAPAMAAACGVAASTIRAGAAAFLALEAALIVSMAWLDQDIARNGNSTAAVAFLIWPVFQWGAVAVFFLVAWLFGWRGRDNWPDPEAP
jgi:hypothetical protein